MAETGRIDYRLSQVRASTEALLAGIDDPGDLTDDGRLSETTLLATAREVRALRPAADVAIDQCHLDADSLCRRIRAICDSRPMALSRVAFVGDDDLALIGLLRTAAPEHVLLLDIDERIIATTQAQAEPLGHGGRLTVQRVDLSSDADVMEVRARFGETFDVVVTDPPYAQDGMAQFLDVAMALTAYTGEIHIAVPALLAEAWTDELLHSVQMTLVSSGFVIDRLVPGAFRYETSDVVSSLVIARRLPGSRLPARNEEPGIDRFYTTRVAPARASLLDTPIHTEHDT